MELLWPVLTVAALVFLALTLFWLQAEGAAESADRDSSSPAEGVVDSNTSCQAEATAETLALLAATIPCSVDRNSSSPREEVVDFKSADNVHHRKGERTEILKSGTWLYDSTIKYEVWIVKQTFEGENGETECANASQELFSVLYLCDGRLTRGTEFLSQSEAVDAAERAIPQGIFWDNHRLGPLSSQFKKRPQNDTSTNRRHHYNCPHLVIDKFGRCENCFVMPTKC
jgi:hypothetical protein